MQRQTRQSKQCVTGKRLRSVLSRATDILASYLVFLLILTMPLEIEDVQAIAQALQALLPAVPDAAPSAISAFSIKCRHSGPHGRRCGSARWNLNSKTQPVITADLTKFNHFVAALDNVTAGEVEAIILSPTTNDKYSTP